MEVAAVSEKIRALSGEFAADRRERQRRRELVPADFARLREAGFPLTGVPVDQGGIWECPSRSARPICDMLRVLAHGDSSVALVCAMHPSMLSYWIATPEAPAPFAKAWEEQRRSIFRNVCEDAWWGTIASEPGASGDLTRSKATARRDPSDGGYGLSGQKNMGSGSGITSFMLTVAIPEGEAAPDVFFLDMRKVPWDGSAGVTLTGAWDGQGMTATQSHAMSFKDFPATRIAWPGQLASLGGATGGIIQCYFTAVIAGVAEVALDTAREQVARRRDELRAYERLEWARAELEGWFIAQAHEGMLRPIEAGRDGRHCAIRA